MNHGVFGFFGALFEGPTCRFCAMFDGFTCVFSDVLDGVAGFLGGIFDGVLGRGCGTFSLRNRKQSCKGGHKRQRGNQFIHDRTFSCRTTASDA
jgi:hypothetical protein